jgi:hypothetical protein
MIKPKTVDSELFDSILSSGALEQVGSASNGSTLTAYAIKPSHYSTVYDLLVGSTAKLPDYLDSSSKSESLFMSLMKSASMTNLLLDVVCHENNISGHSWDTGIFAINNISNFKTFLGGKIRNSDFITLASGYHWEGNDENWAFSHQYQWSGVDETNLTGSVWRSTVGRLISLFFLHLIDEFNRPLDFTFFPFTDNTCDFASSKWTVPSDSENIAAFRKFVATATLVVFAVSAAVAVSVTLKRANSYLARQALYRKSFLDRKIAAGLPLTNKEMKAYRRSTLRLQKSGLINGGLQQTIVQSSTEGRTDFEPVTKSLSEIRYLISGD